MNKLTRTDKDGVPSIVQSIVLNKGDYCVDAVIFNGRTFSEGYNHLTEKLHYAPNSLWLDEGTDSWYKDLNAYFEKCYFSMIKHSGYTKRIMERGISNGFSI